MKQLFITLLAVTTIPRMLCAADVVKENTQPAATNSAAAPYLLPTNRPCCFYANNMTSATFMKFAPDGFYEIIQREHMGVMPRGGGRWSQETNGVVTLKTMNKIPSIAAQRQVRPMTYRDRTFLVWPDVSYKSDLKRALQRLDAKNTPRYHEFMISEEEYKKGTATPYPFRYRKEMSKVTGAKE